MGLKQVCTWSLKNVHYVQPAQIFLLVFFPSCFNATNGVSDFRMPQMGFQILGQMGFLILNATNGVSDFECHKWLF